MSAASGEIATFQEGDLDAAAIGEAWREAGLVPAHRTRVSMTVVGQDETLWLGHDTPGVDSVTWSAPDGHGAPQGKVRLPRTRDPRGVRGDLHAVVERDEPDVQHIVL